MKIGYRAGYSDGFEAGYAQALSDCKEQLERATVNGVLLGYRAIYERFMSPPPPDVSRFQWFLSAIQELEESLELPKV